MISKEELLDRQRRLIAYRKKQEAMHRERCIYCGRFVSMNDDQVDGSFEVVQNPGSCDPDPVEEILHWHNSCKKPTTTTRRMPSFAPPWPYRRRST